MNVGRVAAVGVLALLLVGVAGCDDHEAAAPVRTRPSLAPIACPPVVDDVLMSGYTCATLTTSGTAASPPVRLLVTTVRPAAGAGSSDPVIVVGEDLATTLNYAGLAPAADRLQRTLVLLNPRGVVGSEPDLACPEVDELGPLVPEGGTGAWTDAVGRCATRLAGAGVDVTTFGQDQMAGDVLDLVEALGSSQWNLGAWGSSGRVALEVLRRDPAGLRSVFLDSPETPADDSIGDVAERTAAAVSKVLDACADQPACRALPHTLADLDRIAAGLDAAPLRTIVGADARPVLVDGDLLVRLVRHLVSNNGAASQYFTAGAVPALLAAADGRDGPALAKVVEPTLSSVSYCEGFLPTCSAHHRVTLGSYLTTVCDRLRSSSGATDGSAPVPASTALSHASASDPYRAACGSWPTANEPGQRAPIRSDVPVLLMTGAFDPYVDPAPQDAWREELSGLSRLTMVEVPGWGHNVLASGDCAQGMRNSFVADPTAPVDQSCLAAVPAVPSFLRHL